jgi:hypothetical protein
MIKVVSGLIDTVLGAFGTVSLSRTHFYYFDLAFSGANTFAKFLCWLDWAFHFDYITPTKPWNRYDPNFTHEHGHEIFQTSEPHTINPPR